MTWARDIELRRCGLDLGFAIALQLAAALQVVQLKGSIQDVSMIEVVKFSGVISDGMVTSGTTCGTYYRLVLCRHCEKLANGRL